MLLRSSRCRHWERLLRPRALVRGALGEAASVAAVDSAITRNRASTVAHELPVRMRSEAAQDAPKGTGSTMTP